MERKDFEIELKKIIVKKLELESINEIDGNKTMKEYFNSITYIQFVVAVEEKFCIEVEDDALNFEEFDNMDFLIEFLYKQIASKNSNG